MGRMGEKENMSDTIGNLTNFLLLMFLCVLVTFVFVVDFLCRYCDYRNLNILGILIHFKVRFLGKKKPESLPQRREK